MAESVVMLAAASASRGNLVGPSGIASSESNWRPVLRKHSLVQGVLLDALGRDGQMRREATSATIETLAPEMSDTTTLLYRETSPRGIARGIIPACD